MQPRLISRLIRPTPIFSNLKNHFSIPLSRAYSTPKPIEPVPTPSTQPIETIPPTPKVEPTSKTPSLALSYLLDEAAPRPKSKRESTTEKQRKAMTRSLLIASVVATIGLVGFGAREWDELEEMKLVARSDDFDTINLLKEGGIKACYARAVLRAEDLLNYLNKPAWEPLIPPPLPEPHGRPFTLVVDLDDLLVHSSWDIEHGWRTAKRPGVDYFLAYLSQFYEIVLFTTQPSYVSWL